jgi:hypothetical protein
LALPGWDKGGGSPPPFFFVSPSLGAAVFDRSSLPDFSELGADNRKLKYFKTSMERFAGNS